MSSDDQYFLDVLSSIPNDVRRYSMEVADAIDRHVELVVASVKDTLAHSTWFPQAIRPKPPPPPQIEKSLSTTQRLTELVSRWIIKHKLLTAAIVIAVGAQGLYIIRRYKRLTKRRRARRASNGARREVIVIAGAAHEPITRSLSLDLERRGFIVYVIVNSFEEEQMVNNESRVDIRPLTLDITHPSDTQGAIERFGRFLRARQHAFPGASPHHLHLAGFIVIPNTTYPSGPLETISPEIWSDALNVKVLGTVATTQAFLRLICDFKARVLLLTPNIIPSLALPFHGIESSVLAALEAYIKTLRAELSPSNLHVLHFKLGTFDYGPISGAGRPLHHHQYQNQQYLQPINSSRADVLTWSSSARNAYGKKYLAQATATRSWSGVGEPDGRVRGSQLRDLHRAVFDALVATRPHAVWHVGSGSLLYDLVGRWVPPGLVGRMLGVRRRIAPPTTRDEELAGMQEPGWFA